MTLTLDLDLDLGLGLDLDLDFDLDLDRGLDLDLDLEYLVYRCRCLVVLFDPFVRVCALRRTQFFGRPGRSGCGRCLYSTRCLIS